MNPYMTLLPLPDLLSQVTAWEEGKLRVLIDTNVFIERESNWAISEELQELENLLKTQGHDILVHPLSKQEIQGYENDEGRERAESKIETYAQLTFPNYPKSSDVGFRQHVSEADGFNEQVDNALLFSVYQGDVDVLITEDQGIHRKAGKLGVEGSVLTIEEGAIYFRQENPEFGGTPSIRKEKLRNLDVDDPIFDSLKEEYDFRDWFESHPDRDAYINWNPYGTIGAILILKPGEKERIGHDPTLRKKDRLKISTLKVAKPQRGSKAGELLIDIAIREAIHHGLEEIYLTHRVTEDDHLVQLISNYGFQRASEMDNDESVFVKRLTPGPNHDPGPMETHLRFYPSLYDGNQVDTFLIPIQPDYHGKLFTSYGKRQPKIQEFSGEFLSEGNAIKKAYLTKSNTRKIEAADILLFYRSKDHMEITTLGVCEQVIYDISDAKEVSEIVGKRSVFAEDEIEQLIGDSAVTVILFKRHFNLENPIHYHNLRERGILSGPPQAIQEIDEDGYRYVRDSGGVDERFIIH